MKSIEILYEKQNGKCYYCSGDTILFKDIKDKKIKRRAAKGKQLPNLATKEHLYPKTDIRRMVIKNNEYIVMACSNCNSILGTKAAINDPNLFLESKDLLIRIYNGNFKNQLII